MRRHSGRGQTREDAGIRAKGARVRVAGVAVSDSLFGITLGPCPNCTIEHCRVDGLPGEDEELRGDGIKLWESSDSVVRNNVVEHVRDVVVWYSRRVLLDDLPFRVPGRRRGREVDVRDVALVEPNEAWGQPSCRTGQQDQKARGEWVQCPGMAGPRTRTPTERCNDTERRRACRLVDQRDPDRFKRFWNRHRL